MNDSVFVLKPVYKNSHRSYNACSMYRRFNSWWASFLCDSFPLKLVKCCSVDSGFYGISDILFSMHDIYAQIEKWTTSHQVILN